MDDHRGYERSRYRHCIVEPLTDHTHTMEYAGLVDTRAVWRCVGLACEFSYSRQLTESELDELELPEEEPEPDFPRDWERVESGG